MSWGADPDVLGFVPLPAPLLLAMIGLALFYIPAVELAKKNFNSRAANTNG